MSSSRINLTWIDNSSGESGYEIYRAASLSGPWDQVGLLVKDSVSYADPGLAAGEIYYYRVRAYGLADARSPYSNTAVASTPPVIPAVPSNLSAMALSSRRIDLTWDDNTSNETGFRIQCAPSPSGPWSLIATGAANVTTFSHTNLLIDSTYCYRVCAASPGGDTPFSAVASATTLPTVTSPAKGIFLLDNRNGTNRLGTIRYTNKPWIDGYAWRVTWRAFDTGTTGPQYDFSTLDSAIEQLQAMNKKLSLMLNVQEVPDYVLANADESYLTKVPFWQYSAMTCVPWDQPSLQHYRTFLEALASHPVYDRISGGNVPLRDHPTMGPIRAGVLGQAHVSRDQFGELRRIPSYTRDKYLLAVKNCLVAIQNKFPSKPIHVGFFSSKDNVRSPSLHSAILEMIVNNFDGIQRPRIGLFEECLTGDKPTAVGMYGAALLAGRAAGCPILFQALGSWQHHSLGSWTPGDDTPANGFRHGYNTYGCVYYEMYLEDLYHDPFSGVFQWWHDFLQSLP